MQVLVTGGAGYAGAVLCSELVSRGHQVTLLDNFLYGCEPIFHLLREQQLTAIRRDIREDLADVISKQDAVIHLAGLSGFPSCRDNPAAAHEINVGGTEKVIQALAPSQLLIYASTTSLYGDCSGVCNEESALQPLSLYGKTKLAAEKLVMQRENSIALRLATLFGVSPKMRSDLLINEFCWRAVHERSIVLFKSAARRTFLHVLDAAKAYALCLERSTDAVGNIYNIGSEELSLSKREIADLIKARTDCVVIDSVLEDLDMRDFSLSFEKARTLGVNAEISIEEGLDELLRLYNVFNPNRQYKVI